jgi:hypothetical protein
MFTKEERQALDTAAFLITGNHSDTAQTILKASMYELAAHRRAAGVTARNNWLRSLKALGETCITLAKRESK